VPEPITDVLARALTSVARVTFLYSRAKPVTATNWLPLEGAGGPTGDMVRVLTAKNLVGRIIARLKGTPVHLALMSTRRADTAKRLFDDAGFPWWLQGQIAMLSETDAPPPQIDEESLLALFEEEWTTHAASLIAAGIRGVIKPGVDGDVAGLLSLTDAFEQAVITALDHETRRAGFEWELVSEEALTGAFK
jgi:hypothetical protein